jgi:hypothetical protein
MGVMENALFQLMDGYKRDAEELKAENIKIRVPEERGSTLQGQSGHNQTIRRKAS